MSLQRDKILDLVSRISKVHHPETAELIDIEGFLIYDEILAGRGTERKIEDNSEFRFGGEIVATIGAVGTLVRIVKTLIDFKKYLSTIGKESDDNAQTLQTLWVDRLVSNGIEKETAHSIARDFQRDLLEAM